MISICFDLHNKAIILKLCGKQDVSLFNRQHQLIFSQLQNVTTTTIKQYKYLLKLTKPKGWSDLRTGSQSRRTINSRTLGVSWRKRPEHCTTRLSVCHPLPLCLHSSRNFGQVGTRQTPLNQSKAAKVLCCIFKHGCWESHPL